MSWLQKGIKAWNKVTGQTISEDVTEAEFVDAMESTEPISEAIENSGTLEEINSRILALENSNKAFVTQESLDTQIAASARAAQDVASENAIAIKNNTKLIETNQVAVSKEINAVKGTSSTVGAPASPEPVVKEEEVQTDKDSMIVNTKDFMGSAGSVVPGLI